MGDEYSLFFGGRIAETELFSIGFLSENNLVAAANMPFAAGLRVPITVDLGVAKVQVVPFTTDGLGVSYGFELSSGGIMRANRWSELRREASAVQYNADQGADGGAAAGTALVLQNDMGFINVTKWSSSFGPGAGGGWVPSTNFGQDYVRIALTPSIAGFDIVAGGGMMNGSSFGNLAGKEISAKQTFLDAQVQGEVAGYEAEMNIQYANAPKCDVAIGGGCAYNTSAVADRTAMTIGAEVQVIPHALTLGAAYRSAKNGKQTTAGDDQTDNAITLMAVYDLTQNVALHLNYAMYSGTAYDASGVATNRLLGMLEAAW
jgi:hypothetical protein